MTHFTGHNFEIYSGSQGDVIARERGVIWIEYKGLDTVLWFGNLDDALARVGYVRH